jgi:2-polyprenyl-3-methyl-5-hydroxy-6-metoxy-1,4-benzoquinol methylase
VPGCCDPRGYDRTFNQRFARRSANRYRRHGLDKTARRIVELVEEHGARGYSVLEIGGGVGEIQVELLKRGAVHATNLELSSGYEREAERLLAESGTRNRVDRRIADIATAPDGVAPADVVVLNRVVCCYPDYARLLGAAADHARDRVVFSHPPRNLVSRTVVATQNLVLRLLRNDFRVFTHPPQAMLDVLAERGLLTTRTSPALVWQVAAAHRSHPVSIT